MNKNLHKIIFSRNRNSYVVVTETASSVSGSSRGSSTGSKSFTPVGFFFAIGLSLSFLLMASAFSAPVLPQGGVVAQGNVAVSQSGNVLTVNQSSDKAIVNWQSFSVGTGAAVNIVQPGTSSTHLSRVTSNDPSVIQGQLNSNGQVVLVNPNGIVVAKDGSVSASSFTASTLNITDADFMAGKYQYARNGANGEVVNQGKIQTKAGGYVALLGAKVTNEGTITSQQGAVYLGAGDAVAVPVTGSGRIKFEVSPAAINTSVSNNKDAVIVAEGGQVYMRAASLNDLAVASVQQSGLVDVSGAQGGNVTVLADKGRIKVDGTIKANSTVTKKGGNIIIGHDLSTGVLAAAADSSYSLLESRGGFVETSGQYLVTEGIKVLAAEWSLDPNNIEINATASPNTPGNSVVRSSDINAALNLGTSVTISTGTGAGSTSLTIGVHQETPGTGNTSPGYINVNENISKTTGGSATLTLKANTDIVFAANKKITSTSGALNVVLNSNMSTTGGAVVFRTGSGIESQGGDIRIGGGVAGDASGFAKGSSTNLNGVYLSGAMLNAGGGNIIINAEATSGNSMGMALIGSSQISTSNNGEIKITANGLLTSNSHGLSIEGNSKLSSENGSITINALSGGIGNSRFGLRLTAGGKITTKGGNIDITAQSQTNGLYGYGAMITGAGSEVSTLGTGNITMNVSGSARGTGDALGMQLRSKSAINAVDGRVEVIATSRGTKGNYNIGIDFQTPGGITTPGDETGSISVSGAGSVNLTGIGGLVGDGSFGISTPRIKTSGGKITLTGDSIISNYIVPMSIQASNGTVIYQNYTDGLAINLGGNNILSGSTGALEITTNQLSLIQASNIIIGNNLSGSITTQAAIPSSSVNGDIHLISGKQVNVNHAVNVGNKTISVEAGADININNAITTLNTTPSAISLVAGKPFAAGTATGGDVKISTNSSSLGSLTAGTGARISIYTGSVTGSTGVSAPAGQYRYNSDEISEANNYTVPLSSAGVRVLYREKPQITVDVDSVTKTYDGVGFSGGTLSNSISSGALLNGDSLNVVVQNASIAGNAQGAVNASNGLPYMISASEAINAFGYGVTFRSGALTIEKARLSVTLNNVSTSFGIVEPLTFILNGLVNNETINNAGVSVLGLSSLGYLNSTTTNIPGTYAITASGISAANYALNPINGIANGVLTVAALPGPPVPPIPPEPPAPPTPPVPPNPLVPSESLVPSFIVTSEDRALRNISPLISTSTDASQTSAASAAVVIGGSIQGGEFTLASAEECKTESCFCETSDFDRDVELCYEEDVRAKSPPVRRTQVTL